MIDRERVVRVLTNIKIESLSEAVTAIGLLHKTYRVPHIVITSAKLDPSSGYQCLIGSSARGDDSPRVFRIEYPMLNCHFNGTGDMLAGLMLVRLREAVLASPGVSTTKGWVSLDDVEATQLPLAKAAEKVIASIQAVLTKTKAVRDAELKGMEGALEKDGGSEKRMHLRMTKAAEVRLVRNVEDLKRPEKRYFAEAIES